MKRTHEVGSVIGLVAGLAGAGCGGGGGGVDPLELTIDATDTALVVAQDGDGPWQQLTPDANGVARLEVTAGWYGVVGVCAGDPPLTPRAHVVFDTDVADPDVSCGAVVTTSIVHVTGTTDPGADIWIDLSNASVDATGAYEATVRPGTHDVFAVLPGAPARLLVRRDVDLSADATLDLPVSTDGVDMATMSPTVTGAAASDVTVYADLNNARDEWVPLGQDPTTVPVAPASVLYPGDHPSIGASAAGCSTQKPLGAQPPALALPTPFTATFDAAQVTWQADPAIAWEGVGLSRFTSDAPAASVDYFVSPGWLAATGAGDQLAFLDLTSLPGWHAGLAAISPTQQVRQNIWTYRGIFNGDYNICSASSP